MKLSEMNAASIVRDALVTNPVVATNVFVDQEIPTSKIPDDYISVRQNGPLRRLTTDKMLFEATVMVQINVRLLSTGAANTKKMDAIMDQIEQAIVIPRLVTQPNLIYEGKNLLSNYSTRMLNLLLRITNN